MGADVGVGSGVGDVQEAMSRLRLRNEAMSFFTKNNPLENPGLVAGSGLESDHPY